MPRTATHSQNIAPQRESAFLIGIIFRTIPKAGFLITYSTPKSDLYRAKQKVKYECGFDGKKPVQRPTP